MTAGCLLTAAPTALCHLGRLTNAFLANWSYTSSPCPDRHAPSTPSTPPLRVKASIHATRALQASSWPTILNCLLSTRFTAMAPLHSLDTAWSRGCPSPTYTRLRSTSSPPGYRFFPSLKWRVSSRGISSASPTVHCVPLDVSNQDHRAPNPPSGLSEVSAVTASFLAAPASPSLALLERLSPEQIRGRGGGARIAPGDVDVTGSYYIALKTFASRSRPRDLCFKTSTSDLFSGLGLESTGNLRDTW